MSEDHTLSISGDDRFYALETLTMAIHELDEKKPIKESLYEAGFLLVLIMPADIPNGVLRWAFTGIMHDLTIVPPTYDEGRLAATIVSMTEADCVTVASRIQDLHAALRKHLAE